MINPHCRLKSFTVKKTGMKVRLIHSAQSCAIAQCAAGVQRDIGKELAGYVIFAWDKHLTSCVDLHNFSNSPIPRMTIPRWVEERVRQYIIDCDRDNK